MRPSGVEILFRSWSSTSAGGLTCGKLSHGWSAHELIGQRLHDEFEQHQQLLVEQPTALVSTTPNFLRVMHVAYSKAHKEEDLDAITIAFIAKDGPSPAKIHNARDLAAKSTSDEELKKYDNEYLFEWRIPEDNVIHTVTLGLVHRRGFNLKPCSLAENYFPNLSDLRGRIAKRTAFLAPFDRGYQCGLAACDFGTRAPVKELARQMSEWAVKGRYSDFDWTVAHRGIQEAIESRVITIGVENRMDLEGELLRLQAELDVLEECYLDNVAKLVWELGHDQDSKSHWEALLFQQDERIQSHGHWIANLTEGIYIRIGY